MPNNNEQGKPGTLAVEDFETLGMMVGDYGPKLVAQKVSKILLKQAATLKHEYPASAVAGAMTATAAKLTTAIGAEPRGSIISRDYYSELTGMVNRYGSEVVVQKLAKLAKRSGAIADSNALKVIFPKS
jgi:hypothetical protein